MTDESATGQIPTWRDVNTDAMRVELGPAPGFGAANGPGSIGAGTARERLAAAVARGFDEMYAFLIDHCGALACTSGPLAAFAAATVRYVFRPTRLYAMLLHHALRPASMRNGADFSIELERLACGFLIAPERPANWSVLAAEQRALGQLDVPYFHVAADAVALEGDTGSAVPRFFVASGWHDLQRQLGRLGAADLGLQQAVIRASFDACRARGTDAPAPAAAVVPGAPDAARWLDAAEQVVRSLEAGSIEFDGSNGPEWLSLTYVHEADRYLVDAAGDGLYEGRLGIAVFLTAYQAVRSCARTGLFADRLLAGLARRIDSSSPPELEALGRRRGGLGGGTGSGGIVYGLVCIAHFTSDPRWLARAEHMAAAISAAAIKSDDDLDVIGGSAG